MRSIMYNPRAEAIKNSQLSPQGLGDTNMTYQCGLPIEVIRRYSYVNDNSVVDIR